MTQPSQSPCKSPFEPNERLRHLIGLHFHPEWGSAYWLNRQEKMGWNVPDRIRCMDDLWKLGPMPHEDLRTHPAKSFIPKAFHDQLTHFIVGETAGTSGKPSVTAFRRDEFQEAFISPFLKVVEITGFPKKETWLWVGPTGPHIIGKVVRELAKQTDCMDPFSIDFDPRWAKTLTNGSIARQRYLDHVTRQTMTVLEREDIGILFITPPALNALTPKLTHKQRGQIRGIHYGGMSLTPDMVNEFRSAFPGAVHLAGYGNTLFGVAMEIVDENRVHMDYFPMGERVVFQTVNCTNPNTPPTSWPPQATKSNEPGRVLFHRLDESCLLVGMLERDQAILIPPTPRAIALGARTCGLRNPRPLESMTENIQLGIY